MFKLDMKFPQFFSFYANNKINALNPSALLSCRTKHFMFIGM
jgi:hypothetical protein